MGRITTGWRSLQVRRLKRSLLQTSLPRNSGHCLHDMTAIPKAKGSAITSRKPIDIRMPAVAQLDR